MKTLADLIDGGVAGRTVLVRSDLNVPLDRSNGSVTIADDGRIRASVPTISELSGAGAQVIVVSHLGRPKGGPDAGLSLAPVAARLGELLGAPVRLGELRAGPPSMAAGDVVLLENIRFDPRETSKDDAARVALAGELGALTGADGAFVSDGFGVVHRKQASVYDVARLLPAYAGGLVQAEVAVLRELIEDPEEPFVLVLGGSKVSDKLGVIEALLPQVDVVLVGGGMCFTFYAALDFDIGDSLLEPDHIEACARLLDTDKILLPTDFVVAKECSADAETRVVAAEAIPDGYKGLDIGPESVAGFAEVLALAGTVFWNGPMGVFELAPFAEGTRGVARAVAEAEMSVVGGGDSAAAVRALGLDESAFTHISTGGGASLEFLEGRQLPGLAVLEDD